MNTVVRKFIVADEWLYLKIYTGRKTSEEIIIDVLYPVIREFEKNHFIEKWFFIRYADPEHHIRLRFQLSNLEHLGTLLGQINQIIKPYLYNLLVSNVEIGMYNRELERYGFDNIYFSESFFYYDSVMVIEILEHTRSNENNPDRWLYALATIDAFFNDFNCDDRLKLKIMNELQSSFGKEFHQDKYLLKQVNSKYRRFQKEIEDIMNLQTSGDPEVNMTSKLIDERSQKVRSDVNRAKFISNYTGHEFEGILKSYIHMTMNRIFMSKARLNEYVVYTFLFRHYKSAIARKINKTKKNG